MLAATLIRGMNQILDNMEVAGAAWCHASIVNFTIGVSCPRPSNLEWDSVTPPPRQAGALLTSFTQAFINRGMHFMGSGAAGFVSAAHTEQDIDTCLAAFEGALGDLKASGLL